MTDVTDAHFKECLNHIAGTTEGQIVLYFLMEECGWSKTFLSSEDPQVTQYYAARRGVYGSLRNQIRPEYLKLIEFDYARKVEKNEVKKTEAKAAARKNRVAR